MPTEEFPHPAVTPKAPTPAKINSLTLSSGIRIIAREKDSGVASIKFAVLGGSSSESATQKGAAQFLASTAFAGNEKNSGLRIVRFLESVGATFTATADREKIVYDVSVMEDRVETVVATILSVISLPPHASYVLEEEKPHVQLHYDAYQSDSVAKLTELVHEAAYGEGSALGSSLYAPSLKALSVNETLSYRASHFLRENLVIAASGMTADRLQKMVELYAASLPSKSITPLTLPSSPYTGGEVKVRVEGSGSTDLAVAFPVPAGEAGKPSQVLAGILAGRLAAKGSKATAFFNNYSKGGLLGVRVGGGVGAATNELTAALHELKALASSALETDVVKTKVSLDNFLALEGQATTSYLLGSILAGVSPAQLADVRTVTAQSVSGAAASLLKTEPAYAVLGATAGTPSYAAIKKIIA